MIFDIVKHSLSSPNVLVPVEALIFNAEGSRMPDVRSEALTASIARRVVDVCGTAALALDEARAAPTLSLDYGKCTGCGNALRPAKGHHCGGTRGVRCWQASACEPMDIEGGSEIVGEEAVLTVAAREIRAIVGGALNIRR